MNTLIQSIRGDNQECDQDPTNESANWASQLHYSLVLNHYKNLFKRVSYLQDVKTRRLGFYAGLLLPSIVKTGKNIPEFYFLGLIDWSFVSQAHHAD